MRPSWSYLGAIIGPSWLRGSVRGRSHRKNVYKEGPLLGAILGPPWAILGRLAGILTAILGPSWGYLEAIFDHLGAIVGTSWPRGSPGRCHTTKRHPTRCSFDIVGRSCAILEHLGGILGAPWERLRGRLSERLSERLSGRLHWPCSGPLGSSKFHERVSEL